LKKHRFQQQQHSIANLTRYHLQPNFYYKSSCGNERARHSAGWESSSHVSACGMQCVTLSVTSQGWVVVVVVVVVVEKDIYSKPASFHFFMTMKELHLFSCLKEFLT